MEVHGKVKMAVLIYLHKIYITIKPGSGWKITPKPNNPTPQSSGGTYIVLGCITCRNKFFTSCQPVLFCLNILAICWIFWIGNREDGWCFSEKYTLHSCFEAWIARIYFISLWLNIAESDLLTQKLYTTLYIIQSQSGMWGNFQFTLFIHAFGIYVKPLISRYPRSFINHM